MKFQLLGFDIKVEITKIKIKPMLKVTTWKPDTCDCVIEYEWDDATAEDTRTHSVKNIVKACVHHIGNTTAVNYDKVLNENQRKNRTLGDVMEIPELVEIVIAEDGSEQKRLKRGITYDWSFDVDRNLVVNFKNIALSAAQKATLKSAADSKWGVGKVKIL